MGADGAAQDFEGRQFGRWELHECLGRGGMGVVHAAVHLDTKQSAAIKVLFVDGNVPDSFADRFFQEVHILRRLKHPNIVEVYEFGFADNAGFYIAMELLQGCSLYDWMKQQETSCSLENLYLIASQVCDGMSFAHQREIIHRDLKPENIFLCGGPERLDQIKVLDFGVAKFDMGGGESNRLTQSGTALGTPFYISPEQAIGGEATPQSDIYSLAVLMFELLVGEPLFQAQQSIQLMTMHVSTVPRTLSEARPDLHFPPALEQLLAACLAKRPETRPESMLSVKKRLLEVATGSRVQRPTDELEVFPDAKGVGTYSRVSSSDRTPASPDGPIRPIRIGGEGRENKADTPKPVAAVRKSQAKKAPEPKEAPPVEGKNLQPVVLAAVGVIIGLLGMIAGLMINRSKPVVGERPQVPVRAAKDAGITLPSKEPQATTDAAPQDLTPPPERPVSLDEDGPNKKTFSRWMDLIKKKIKKKKKSPPDATDTKDTPPPPRRKRATPPPRR